MFHRIALAASGACALVSVALFETADLTGALLRPDYSVVSQAISELVEVGAPNKRLIEALLLGYHGLVIPFAVGQHMAISKGVGSRAGPALLMLAGGLGVVLTLFFPCDPGCEPLVTLTGTMHIVIAVPMGFAILFAVLAFSRRLSVDPDWGRRFAIYSRATFAAGIGLAVITLAAAESDFVGVLQRLLTASYLQWYVVMGIGIIRRQF